MEAAQETFFYTPECGRTWRFLDNVHNSTQNGDWSAENRGIAEVYELEWVWSHANVDANFKNLLNQLDIDATNQDSIISDLKLAIGGKELNIPSLFEASHDTLEMEEESNDEWPEIIYEAYYSGVPVEQIPRRYNKRLCEVQTIISLFKKKLRKIHQYNRRFLNKRIKLDHSKLQIIEDYCTKFRFSALTLGDLKRYLIEKVGGAGIFPDQQFPELWGLS